MRSFTIELSLGLFFIYYFIIGLVLLLAMDAQVQTESTDVRTLVTRAVSRTWGFLGVFAFAVLAWAMSEQIYPRPTGEDWATCGFGIALAVAFLVAPRRWFTYRRSNT